jgi:hypothetical protein
MKLININAVARPNFMKIVQNVTIGGNPDDMYLFRRFVMVCHTSGGAPRNWQNNHLTSGINHV